VTEEFIERSCPSLLSLSLRFLPEKIKSPCARVSADLTVPRIIEIDFGEFGEELVLLLLVQLSNGIDYFTRMGNFPGPVLSV
jgi:hypothetical protein